MKKLLEKIEAINELIDQRGIKTISFDVDGTVYPIKKVQARWWYSLMNHPLQNLKFLLIKLKWERRRKGKQEVVIREGDIVFFEYYLTHVLLNESLVPAPLKEWIIYLKKRDLEIYFLSDHGAQAKIDILKLAEYGTAINCLSETGELKPHHRIARLLTEKYDLHASTHLHLGDRWTDEKQAEIFGCSFCFLNP
jgi:FMN phosphatase YigB (HAD superfamily)